jgi:hypothetical protein
LPVHSLRPRTRKRSASPGAVTQASEINPQIGNPSPRCTMHNLAIIPQFSRLGGRDAPPGTGRAKDKASRSKFVAEGDVGSLVCVDRLGSFAQGSAAMSMNESRHSSATRQRSTSSNGATSRGGTPLALRNSGWDHAASFSNACLAAFVVSHLRTVSFSRFRPSLGGTKMSNALFQRSAKNSRQGATPARLIDRG